MSDSIFKRKKEFFSLLTFSAVVVSVVALVLILFDEKKGDAEVDFVALVGMVTGVTVIVLTLVDAWKNGD